jgi:carbonic anhydrase
MDPGSAPPASGNPARQLAIVTCMDARIDPPAALGLRLGDAHVLRNAGAVVSDDVLRSLVLSQRLLGTHSVAVIAHTQCALRNVHDDELALSLEAETGQAPPFGFGAFFDLDEHVRDQVERVRSCPWLPHRDNVRGYVLDIADGSLRTVVEA